MFVLFPVSFGLIVLQKDSLVVLSKGCVRDVLAIANAQEEVVKILCRAQADVNKAKIETSEICRFEGHVAL